MVKKCERCGIQNDSYVRITATCKKCGQSYLICTTCKLSWKSQKCPSCSGWISSGTWNFVDMDGEGSASAEMDSYLSSYDKKAYIKTWNAATETREAERAQDGANKHRGTDMDPQEIVFLRTLEDMIHEPIFTVGDDRGNFVIIQGGHIVKLRLRNTDLEENFPETISSLTKLKELWVERTDRDKPTLKKLPETLSACTELEAVVLRSASRYINITLLAKLPNLKRLSVQGTYPGYDDSSFADLFSLVNLEELNLSYCTVNTGKLEGVGNLTKLKKLNMNWMKAMRAAITKLPDGLQKCQKLEDLSVIGTHIGQKYPGLPWPEWMTSLPNLKLLHFQHRQIVNGAGPILTLLYEKYEDIYDTPEVTPEMKRQFGQGDWDNWYKKNMSDTLKAGWTGIQ